ncbi:MAG: hypothetical protein QOH93_361 [Chloroflexia bacterium]|jgi:uncharacterized membrane protein|nr:hypothetical protein [Chloroflexia bacterium]
MSTQWWIGLVSSFLASGVEVVEAVTIVLAVGVTRGWRSAWYGVVCAAVLLAALVALLGATLQTLIPIDALRIVIGTLLLIFGLQWLRKAIMRYTGLKELHDEEKIYEREVAELREEPAAPSGAIAGVSAQSRPAIDWTAFTVSFKGVLLEGLEVVFIVITFGLTAGDSTPAVIGAVAAALLVTAAALLVHRPLTRVPENTLKFVVGIMLTAFGTFWAGEGVGLQWPGEDLAILGLLVFYAVSAGVIIVGLRARTKGESGKAQEAVTGV